MLNVYIKETNKALERYIAGTTAYPHWKDFVLLPIARDIGLRLGLEYEVSGPFGVRLQCYISLTDKTGKIMYILSVIPRFQGSLLNSIDYDTGEIKEGCIHDLSGFNCVTAPLPNNCEDIIWIMKEHTESDEHGGRA